jgi:hypothetical protein
MLAFAGSIDLPGIAMVIGPILLVLLANGFSLKKFCIVGDQVILDIGLLFLLIASVGLLAKQEDLFAFHLMASMALLTVVFALILKLPFQMLRGAVETYAGAAHIGFRVAAGLAFVVGVYFAELYAADASAFIDASALVYVGVSAATIVLLDKFSVEPEPIRTLSRYFPIVGLVGMALGMVTGLQDIYELASMSALLTFSLLCMQYVLYLRLLMFFFAPEKAMLADTQRNEGLVTIVCVALIGVIFYMVFVSIALA